MNPAVGVDLGTTNTVVAVQTDGTGPRTLNIAQSVEELNVLEPRDHLESAVYFDSVNTAVVGAFAARRIGAFRSIKSRMGTRWQITHPFRRGFPLTPSYISAHILKLAFSQLVKEYPQWDRSAIVTVPASFNTDQRSDTLKAASLAGFKLVKLLDEPTAAFYYFFDQNRALFEQVAQQIVLVFDFGGGTLDVSIIRVNTTRGQISVDPIGRSRYNNLGGDDIDTDIAAFMLSLWEQQENVRIDDLSLEDRIALLQLFLQRSSRYKEEAEYYISIGQPPSDFLIDEELSFNGSRKQVRLHRQLTRQQYEDVSGRFFLNKGDINVFRPIGQALEVAASIVPGFKRDDIDLILYTGGASRMSGVSAAIKGYFKPKPCFSITEEEACNTVALGAASCRYDEQQGQRKVTMTTRLLECILTRDDRNRHYLPIVPLECQPSAEFTPVSTDLRVRRDAVTLKLPLFRGVGPMDHHLMPMGELIFALPRVVPTGEPFTLSYRMTQNKTIQFQVLFFRATEHEFTVDSEVAIDQTGQAADRHTRPLSTVR